MTTWLFVGLGNPGDTYADTRHNIGFWFIDEMARRYDVREADKKEAYHIAKGTLTPRTLGRHNTRPANTEPARILLLKPMTFMNRSGGPTAEVARFFKIKPEHIIAIHDDLDLEVGTVRFKLGGGHGGHNGLKDIDSRIGKGYRRLRLGIGRPTYKTDVVRYVLERPSREDAHTLDAVVHDVATHAPLMLSEPFDAGMFLTKVKESLAQSTKAATSS
ncbi:aminoacyl-tRNA hydrolase [Candidatus Hepatobacter penaei]|uniref:aminoacyl-tRNA hydrolase n=1 Tax=Candidatus Hepatobacter penaei TaxID=1274402 RepID=UPI0004F242DF|nr:aminoacyl-tRNA hydrolase [Candidatus Hepatobacter penaei]